MGRGFRLVSFFSGNLLDRIYDKQNRLLNSELPRHPFYIGLDPCGHKFQRGGKNFVYSESFSGRQNMFCNSLDGVISESGCFYWLPCDFRPSPGGGRWVGSSRLSTLLPLFTSGLLRTFSSFPFLHLNPVFGFPRPLKGSFTIFLFSVRSHILNSNGMWYSWFCPEGPINASN